MSGVLCSDTNLLCRRSSRLEDGIEERAALVREGVHHHLPLTPRADDPVRAEHAHVVGDEVLRPLDDPGEVADTQLVRP
jgi:hypothetical protein